MSTENQFGGNKIDEEFDKIQDIKNQISMFQQKNDDLKKEEEKIDAIKRNLLLGKKDILEEEKEAPQFSPLTYPAKVYEEIVAEEEYEELIQQDSIVIDPIQSDDEEEEYRDTLLEMAQTKILKLENEVVRLKSNAREDDKYIIELEQDIRKLQNNLKKYQSPEREIEYLQNQVENVRHQYYNLSAEYRRKEDTEKEKHEAYDSMKEKFLSHLLKFTKQNKELSDKLEEKEKENQKLRKIIAKFQASQLIPASSSESPSNSQESFSDIVTSTTTTSDESMDLSISCKTKINGAVVNISQSVTQKVSNGSSPDLCF